MMKTLGIILAGIFVAISAWFLFQLLAVMVVVFGLLVMLHAV